MLQRNIQTMIGFNLIGSWPGRAEFPLSPRRGKFREQTNKNG
jgi:hypothetical protein